MAGLVAKRAKLTNVDHYRAWRGKGAEGETCQGILTRRSRNKLLKAGRSGLLSVGWTPEPVMVFCRRGGRPHFPMLKLCSHRCYFNSSSASTARRHAPALPLSRCPAIPLSRPPAMIMSHTRQRITGSLGLAPPTWPCSDSPPQRGRSLAHIQALLLLALRLQPIQVSAVSNGHSPAAWFRASLGYSVLCIPATPDSSP